MFRRDFIRTCGLGIAGVTALNGLSNTRRLATKASVTPRGGAENVLFIFLAGAASHVDTFDLKLGSWTPDDFAPLTVGDMLLPSGLFPTLVDHTDKFSLLRAINGTEAVHQRASYIVETAQTYNPVFAREQPHIGSIIAAELAASRKSDDILPAFLAMNAAVQGPGLLPSTHAAFTIQTDDGVVGLTHPGGEDLFQKRYESLLRTDTSARSQQAAAGSVISDYHNFYDLGRRLMYEPDANDVFTLTEEELARYGETSTGAGCAMAVKAFGKDRGARVVQVTQGGWDMHYDIYNRNIAGNIYDRCAELDQALSATLVDLAAAPGKRGGSLLDETLVLVTGEFGRTPGPLTNNLGRDHYPYAWSALMAGGGTPQGQVLGSTDAEGYGIVDPYWSVNRGIEMQDLVATIYSSLGIDWTKEIQDTPSGRVYEYTPKMNGESGYYKDIFTS